MTAYFRLPEDKTLLMRNLRNDADLTAIVAEAEARVIAFYTRHATTASYRDRALEARFERGFTTSELAYAVRIGGTDDPVYVFLRGYAVDADACTNDLLKAAIRREVARVARWMKAQSEKEPLLESESKEDGSDTYRGDSEDDYPPDFGLHLRPWNVLPPYDGL